MWCCISSLTDLQFFPLLPSPWPCLPYIYALLCIIVKPQDLLSEDRPNRGSGMPSNKTNWPVIICYIWLYCLYIFALFRVIVKPLDLFNVDRRNRGSVMSSKTGLGLLLSVVFGCFVAGSMDLSTFFQVFFRVSDHFGVRIRCFFSKS